MVNGSRAAPCSFDQQWGFKVSITCTCGSISVKLAVRCAMKFFVASLLNLRYLLKGRLSLLYLKPKLSDFLNLPELIDSVHTHSVQICAPSGHNFFSQAQKVSFSVLSNHDHSCWSFTTDFFFPILCDYWENCYFSSILCFLLSRCPHLKHAALTLIMKRSSLASMKSKLSLPMGHERSTAVRLEGKKIKSRDDCL